MEGDFQSFGKKVFVFVFVFSSPPSHLSVLQLTEKHFQMCQKWSVAPCCSRLMAFVLWKAKGHFLGLLLPSVAPLHPPSGYAGRSLFDVARGM